MFKIEISEHNLKVIIQAYLKSQLGNHDVDLTKMRVEVKLKQNCRAEWETANCRIIYEGQL